MIKVRPQVICTEGPNMRPESKQTGIGQATTKLVLVSATPIKCCRLIKESIRRAGLQGRLESLIAHVSSLHANKGDEKRNKGKSWKRHPQPIEKPLESRDIQLQLMNRNQKLLDDDDIAFGICGIGHHHITVFTNC